MVPLLALLLLTGCVTAQQVRWNTYAGQLKTRIDSAAAAGDCGTLDAILADAVATSGRHARATGVPNDALVVYIQAARSKAGCR